MSGPLIVVQRIGSVFEKGPLQFSKGDQSLGKGPVPDQPIGTFSEPRTATCGAAYCSAFQIMALYRAPATVTARDSPAYHFQSSSHPAVGRRSLRAPMESLPSCRRERGRVSQPPDACASE